MKQASPMKRNEAVVPHAKAAAGHPPVRPPAALRNGNGGGQTAGRATGLKAAPRDRVRPVRKSRAQAAGPAEFPDIPSLGDQLRESLAELQAQSAGAKGHGRVVTRRAVEVKEPGAYDDAAVRDLR